MQKEDFLRASTYLCPLLFIAGLAGVRDLRTLAVLVCVLGTVDSLAMRADGTLSHRMCAAAIVMHILPVLTFIRDLHWKPALIAASCLVLVLAIYVAAERWPYRTERGDMVVIGATLLLCTL